MIVNPRAAEPLPPPQPAVTASRPLPLRRARLLAGALALLLAAPAQAENQAVRIATEGAYPPFNYVDANNQPAGFEVELGTALCAAAHLTCTWVVQDWDGLIAGLLESRYDAIMASLAITEKRKARIAFTQPYYRIPAAF